MRVFQTKSFERYSRKNRIGDKTLCTAIERVVDGLLDADLGGGLIKQRVARPGQGRSSGFRTIIAFRSPSFACFLYGFAKKDLANVDEKDMAHLHDLAAKLLSLSVAQLERAVADKNLFEVKCEKELP